MASEESKLEKTNNNQAEEPTRLELKEMLLYKKTELSNIVREDSKLQTRWRAQDHNTGTERIIIHVQGHFFFPITLFGDCRRNSILSYMPFTQACACSADSPHSRPEENW